MTLDQQIQIARTVLHARQTVGDNRGVEFVRRVAVATGLSLHEVSDMLHRTAHAHHSLDKATTFEATFREFFRNAG